MINRFRDSRVYTLGRRCRKGTLQISSVLGRPAYIDRDHALLRDSITQHFAQTPHDLMESIPHETLTEDT